MPTQTSSRIAQVLCTTRRLSILSFIGLSSTGLLVSAAHAQASSSDWVSTRTHAFDLPAATAAASGAQATTHAASGASANAELGANESVHVVVTLKLRDQKGLDSFIDQVNRPGSPNYRQYLTPDQILSTYAPTEAQANAVVQYLTRAGFTNVHVAKNRMLVSADGTAATVKAAFNTSLRRFSQAGRPVYANASDAQVPAALGDIVDSVQGLQNAVTAHTNYVINEPGASASTQASVSARTAAAATPVLTGHNPVEFSNLYAAGSTPTASATTVGIISEGDLTQTLSDLRTFTTNNGLAAVSTKVVQTGAPGSDYSDTDGTVEWNLDSQSIVGAAGGAVKQLVFYDAPSMSLGDITDAYNQAVSDNVAKVINVSLGVCEASAHQQGSQSADDSIFKIAMAQGQTFSVSAGDHGVYECQGGYPPSNLRTYSVSEPATSPYVISVGGTALYTTNGKYDHETTWNSGLDQYGSLWATGGGVSKYEAAPSWQSSVTNNQARVVPDIGFDADNRSGAILVYKGQTSGTLKAGQPNQVGGTSLAAPIFSGIWARVQSANNNALAFPAASIYSDVSANPALVHPVVSGNNGVVRSGVTYGYSAGPGFDFVTGWGSFDIAQLNAAFSSSPTLASGGSKSGSGSAAQQDGTDLFGLLAGLFGGWLQIFSAHDGT
ncbi:S53 family peptidase [Paraburkholderia sp.]|uniref:S53 family peptidase n=1 Tax=Paraburkholderia sp. TaxID=1926495 RepID=UPI003D6E9676